MSVGIWVRSRSHLSKVPADWVRKQTIAGGERYVTEELAEHEARVLSANERALSREQELYLALRGRVSAEAERLVVLGERVAAIDVLAGLADIAAAHDYVRPEIVDERAGQVVAEILEQVVAEVDGLGQRAIRAALLQVGQGLAQLGHRRARPGARPRR